MGRGRLLAALTGLSVKEEEGAGTNHQLSMAAADVLHRLLASAAASRELHTASAVSAIAEALATAETMSAEVVPPETKVKRVGCVSLSVCPITLSYLSGLRNAVLPEAFQLVAPIPPCLSPRYFGPSALARHPF